MVFQDKEVGDFVNEQFVNLKLYSKKGEEPYLRKKFNVPGYPTLIILDSKGDEIDRITGFDGNRDTYFETIKNYAEGKNTLNSYLTEFQNDSTNVETNFMLAMKYVTRREMDKAQKYLIKTLELDPKNEKGHKNKCLFHTAVYKARTNKNIKPLESFIQNTQDEQFLVPGYFNIIHHYESIEDSNKVIETYEKAVEIMPKNTDIMNGYTWYIFEGKIKDKYARGIELAKKAVEINPEADNIWDTLAWLYFENGNIDEAIKAMRKATELDPEQDYYKENLKKFKKAL